MLMEDFNMQTDQGAGSSARVPFCPSRVPEVRVRPLSTLLSPSSLFCQGYNTYAEKEFNYRHYKREYNQRQIM